MVRAINVKMALFSNSACKEDLQWCQHLISSNACQCEAPHIGKPRDSDRSLTNHIGDSDSSLTNHTWDADRNLKCKKCVI